MIVSFLVAIYFQFGHETLGLAPLHASVALVVGVAITTLAWLTVTFLTSPVERETLQSFFDRIRPFERGWRAAVDTTARGGPKAVGSASAGLLAWALGCLAVYSALFGTGYLLYGRFALAAFCLGLTATAAIGLFRIIPKVGFE